MILWHNAKFPPGVSFKVFPFLRGPLDGVEFVNRNLIGSSGPAVLVSIPSPVIGRASAVNDQRIVLAARISMLVNVACFGLDVKSTNSNTHTTIPKNFNRAVSLAVLTWPLRRSNAISLCIERASATRDLPQRALGSRNTFRCTCHVTRGGRRSESGCRLWRLRCSGCVQKSLRESSLEREGRSL